MTSLSNTLMKTAAWFAGILPDTIKRQLYRLPFLSNPIRTALNAAAPDGFTTIEIASGPAKGLKMTLDLKAEKDYWLGTYEPDLRDAAKKLIKPSNVIYDVGANLGYISLLSASLAGLSGHVYAFEALPANIERLSTNVTINGLSASITIIHAAVTDRNGPVTFYTHRSGAMGKVEGSAGRDEEYLDRIKVDGIALDRYVYANRNPAPDIVKMDIEGGEGNALQGSKQLLSTHKPTFMIELHGKIAASQVWDILVSNAYQIHTLQNGYPRIKNLDQLDWKAYIVAVHASKAGLLK